MNILKYRKYLWDSAVSELRNRYAGSSLGSLWNVIQPLFQILIYTFVFSQIMIAKLPGIESTTYFAIYLCAGLVPWLSFSEIIVRGSNAFIENATYLKKLPIPEYLFVLQTGVVSSIILFISMGILFIIVIIMGGTISFLWLLVPLILALLVVFGIGIAIIFASINVFFRDFGQLLGTLVHLWLWLTPIVYVKELLPEDYRHIIDYNPLYYYIESLQGIIVFSEAPEANLWVNMLITSSITIFAGTLIVRKLRSEIRDVI